MGAYFAHLEAIGGYYNFLGIGQLLAAVLLLHPRTASLGAAIYLPIVLNIFVLTMSVPFGGTPLITGLMLLACIYLLCWDLPLWLALLSSGKRLVSVSAREYLWSTLVYGAGSAVAFALLASRGIGNLDRTGVGGELAATAAGAVFGLACAWHVRQGASRLAGR